LRICRLQTFRSQRSLLENVPGLPPEQSNSLNTFFLFAINRLPVRLPPTMAHSLMSKVAATPPFRVTLAARFLADDSFGFNLIDQTFGALLQRPSIEGIGKDIALEEFPAALATRGLERWLSRVTRTGWPAPLRGVLS
jgi:hypothetical protein